MGHFGRDSTSRASIMNKYYTALPQGIKNALILPNQKEVHPMPTFNRFLLYVADCLRLPKFLRHPLFLKVCAERDSPQQKRRVSPLPH